MKVNKVIASQGKENEPSITGNEHMGSSIQDDGRAVFLDRVNGYKDICFIIIKLYIYLYIFLYMGILFHNKKC